MKSPHIAPLITLLGSISGIDTGHAGMKKPAEAGL